MRVVVDGWLFTWVRGGGVRWAMQCLEGWVPAGTGDSVVVEVPHEGAAYVPPDMNPRVECVVGEAQTNTSCIEA